jgi:superfamily II DNA or RNA helicase
MEVSTKRNKIQEEGLESWIERGGNSSLIISQGVGKSFIMYKAFYRALTLGWITNTDPIFIFSFTKDQGSNLKKEASVFESVYGKNPLKDFNLEFWCYQSIPRHPRTFDVYDELDATLTPEYMRNLTQSPARYKLGLTGTESAGEYVFKDIAEQTGLVQSDASTRMGKVTHLITKGQLIEIYLPVSYRYTREQAVLDGIIADMQTIIINHTLDDTHKRIWYRSRKKTKKEIVPKYTEKEWYAKKKGAIQYQYTPTRAKQVIGQQMSRFLYNLPSKAVAAKKLLKLLPGKTIIFSERLALLNLITPNVVTSKASSSFVVDNIFYNKKKVKKDGQDVFRYLKRHLLELKEKFITQTEYDTVKSIWLTTRVESKILFEKFNRGEITEIASSKAIGRGMTLDNVDNGILLSYGSKHTPMSQKVARTWRTDGKLKKTANLYVFRTINTYEEAWFESMQYIYGTDKKLIGKMDLNIVREIPSLALSLPNFKL